MKAKSGEYTEDMILKLCKKLQNPLATEDARYYAHVFVESNSKYVANALLDRQGGKIAKALKTALKRAVTDISFSKWLQLNGAIYRKQDCKWIVP